MEAMKLSDKAIGIFLDRAQRLEELKKLATIASDWFELRCLHNMRTFQVKYQDRLEVSDKINGYYRSLIDAESDKPRSFSAIQDVSVRQQQATAVTSVKKDAKKQKPKDKLLKLGGLIKQLRQFDEKSQDNWKVEDSSIWHILPISKTYPLDTRIVNIENFLRVYPAPCLDVLVSVTKKDDDFESLHTALCQYSKFKNMQA